MVGTDQPSDLAVSRSMATESPAARRSAIRTACEVGDVVLAVGNPLGVGQTVTMGIISAKGRSTGAGSGSYEDFLQTDAPINHGNSGGALVNLKGELVGINSQILSPTARQHRHRLRHPVEHGEARHGSAADERQGHARAAWRERSGGHVRSGGEPGPEGVGGALIGSVTPDSAAERAGLKRGDVIQAFNGQPVRDTNALRNRVADAAPGSTADVADCARRREKHVSVKLDEASPGRLPRAATNAERDDKAPSALRSPADAGAGLAHRLPRNTQGLVVEDVDPDGRAADGGIEPGDIIEEVNRQQVQTVDELRAAVKKSPERPLLLLVNREGRGLFVTVRPR